MTGRAVSGDRRLFEQALRERIGAAALSASATVTAAQMEQMFGYYELLRRWNERVNLTALSLSAVPPPETVERLFVEPLVAAQYVEDNQDRWFDFGSGGGSPAIPLKIVRPALELTLVESRSRKAAFLREAVRGVALERAEVSDLRVEELPRRYEQGAADMITVRGLRMDAVVFSVAAELLRQGGRLFLFGAPGRLLQGSLFRQVVKPTLPSSGFLFVLERAQGMPTRCST